MQATRIVVAWLLLFSTACISSNEMNNCNAEATVANKFEYEVVLDGPYSLSAVGRKNSVDIDGSVVPFGHINHEWQKLKQRYETGDCIYEFESVEGWEWPSGGRKGIVLVRNDKVIAGFITGGT